MNENNENVPNTETTHQCESGTCNHETNQAVDQPTIVTSSKGLPEFNVHPAEATMPVEQPRKAFPSLTAKDMRILRENGYERAKEKFHNIYLIRNMKTGKIAELHAASAFHAAKLLNWNPKRTQLLMQREDGKAPVTPEPKG